MIKRLLSAWRTACEVPAAAKRDHRRAIVLIEIWAAVWMATLVLLRKGTIGGEIGVALAILTSIIGVAMVMAYVRFLGALDELQRKIQTDALALGFGLGLVAMVAYDLLGRAGVDLFSLDPVVPLAVMVMGYIVGVVLAARRYA